MKITKLIPKRIKQSIRNAYQDSDLWVALLPLRETGVMSPGQVEKFYKAWGNEGFAADKDYLNLLLTMLDSGPVLECGTGGTTLLANVMGQRNGFRTYSLEQDPGWAKPAKRALKRSEAVTVLDTPLRDFGAYQWYDVRVHLPQHFSLVICDGPYIDEDLGEPAYSAWRYGVLPWFKDNNKSFDRLLLDDVNDSRARAILHRWEREFGVSVQIIESPDGECAVVRAPR